MAAGLQREHQRAVTAVPAEGHSLSIYSLEELDDVADSLNSRPRKILEWRTSLEFYFRGAQEFRRWPQHLPIAWNVELEAADVGYVCRSTALKYYRLSMSFLDNFIVCLSVPHRVFPSAMWGSYIIEKVFHSCCKVCSQGTVQLVDVSKLK